MLNLLRADFPKLGGKRWAALRLLLFFLFRRDDRNILIYIRLGQMCHRRGWRRGEARCAYRLRRDFGCFVGFDAEIGPGLRLPHPNGIVIGHGVRIGARCRIYQQVTMGGARAGDWQANNYPVIGDDVTVFAGAKLIGTVDVGDRAQIGANAVVLRDVPADHSAIGIPAQSRPKKVSGRREPPD